MSNTNTTTTADLTALLGSQMGFHKVFDTLLAAVKRTQAEYGTYQLHLAGVTVNLVRGEDGHTWEIFTLEGDKEASGMSTINEAKERLIYHARFLVLKARSEAEFDAEEALNKS